MSTIATRLRALAVELEQGNVDGGVRLVPIPADQVVPGDVIWPDPVRSVKVDRIEIVDSQPPNHRGASMLGLWGPYAVSPDYPGQETRHITYGDEWVVGRAMSRRIAAVVDAFNRHGSFTARASEDVFHCEVVEVRHVDTGELAATVWCPVPDTIFHGWRWLIEPPNGGVRKLTGDAGIDELVRAVATSVLDERPKR